MSAPELALQFRPEQRMLMLPRMLQALDVLQLPQALLGDVVSAALAENEALCRSDAPATDPRLDRSRRRGDEHPRGRAASREADVLPEAPDAKPRTLATHLHEQIALLAAPTRIASLLHLLVASLDESGFRTASRADLGSALEPCPSDAEWDEAERLLARLDPPGVGAEGPLDALLRQAALDPDAELLQRLLRDHLSDLAHQRRDDVARALAVSREDLECLLGKLGRLRPRPGAGFATERTERVRPEVIVETRDAGFDLRLEGSTADDLEIDPAVLDAARDRRNPPEIRAHLRERIEAARGFLDAVAQRRATLLRVSRGLLERQPAFLQHGPRHVRPLRMIDLADSLGIHASTVSRAVAGKWMESPWGVHRLRDFFGAAVSTTHGETATRDDLKEAIRGAFAAEDPACPLGDGDVVRQLRTLGFLVARRTVAKYRADLGIPSKWCRRAPLDAAH